MTGRERNRKPVPSARYVASTTIDQRGLAEGTST
jgi:hypothetical protein